MSIEAQLDECIAGVEALHRRQNEAQIRNYCRRVERLLGKVIALLDELRGRDDAAGVAADRHRLALERWAERVVGQINESTLYRCDPRLEQTLLDLVNLLEEALAPRA